MSGQADMPPEEMIQEAPSCFCIDPLGEDLRNIWWINSILCSMGVLKKVKSHYERFQFSVNECQILYNKSQKVPYSFSVGSSNEMHLVWFSLALLKPIDIWVGLMLSRPNYMSFSLV